MSVGPKDELALVSELLERHGFRHAFSTRKGGVSLAPFDSLNLARSVGDDPAHVEENHARFAAVVPYDALFQVSQVHGAHVHLVRDDEEPGSVSNIEGDALVLPSGRAAAVGVRVADCAPVLLGDLTTGAVAAVHAGWRGVVAGVIGASIDALVAIGAKKPGSILAAIGPHIRAASFEVGEDVAFEIERAAGVSVIVRGPSSEGPERAKPHVDLAKAVTAQLRARGVRQIEDVGGDTFADADRFFSFRRDGKRSGRHLAAIRSRA